MIVHKSKTKNVRNVIHYFFVSFYDYRITYIKKIYNSSIQIFTVGVLPVHVGCKVDGIAHAYYVLKHIVVYMLQVAFPNYTVYNLH